MQLFSRCAEINSRIVRRVQRDLLFHGNTEPRVTQLSFFPERFQIDDLFLHRTVAPGPLSPERPRRSCPHMYASLPALYSASELSTSSTMRRARARFAFCRSSTT